MTNAVLKTLISEMIDSRLDESHEGDLIESIFQEVSEDTWQAIEEMILSELSPSTLGKFVRHRATFGPALTQDAKRFNAPKHWGAAIEASSGMDEAEILPLSQPKLRRVKARRNKA